MSYVHVNHVRDHSKTKGVAKLLLICIATRADKAGIAYPAYPCLAKDIASSIRSVRRLLERDPNKLKGEPPAIPPNELEIIPGGSNKGERRRPTYYRILITVVESWFSDLIRVFITERAPDAHNGETDIDETAHTSIITEGDGWSVAAFFAETESDDHAPDAHGTNNDHAPDAHGEQPESSNENTTRPCASVQPTLRIRVPDRAPDAHLTVLTDKKTKKKLATRAKQRDSNTPSGSGTVKRKISKRSSKLFLNLSEAAMEELQHQHPYIDVRSQRPLAEAKCQEEYPGGGAMKRPYFVAWLDRVNTKMNAVGMIEVEVGGEKELVAEYKAEELAEASRHRRESMPSNSDIEERKFKPPDPADPNSEREIARREAEQRAIEFYKEEEELKLEQRKAKFAALKEAVSAELARAEGLKQFGAEQSQ